MPFLKSFELYLATDMLASQSKGP